VARWVDFYDSDAYFIMMLLHTIAKKISRQLPISQQTADATPSPILLALEDFTYRKNLEMENVRTTKWQRCDKEK
jgi:hypothetical protein